MFTTVVGNYPKSPNLPRPARLRKAIADFDQGKITREDLARVADDVTTEVIREQEEAGLDLITDGKIRWEDEQTYLMSRLTGVSINGLIRYFDSNTYYRQPIVEGPVRWTGPITVRDYQYAASHSATPVKAALTGPYTLARLSANRSDQSFQSIVTQLAEALNQEARALEAAGCNFIQFDEPAIARSKGDWEFFASVMPRLAEGLKAKRALYIYFGDVEGLYPQVLDLPFELIGLDFVQGARNWQLLSKAPFTKELGLGIVDARNTKLETADDLRRLVTQASQWVSSGKIQVSPTSGLEFLPRERAQEKLANMVAALKGM